MYGLILHKPIYGTSIVFFIRSAFEIKVAEMMNFLKYKCFHFLWISHLVDMLQPVQSNVHSTGKF